MGSPIAPLLANVFMCASESVWLNNCPAAFKPLYYRRYVDDTFVIFRKPDHARLFLQYLNAQHPCIKFTCEEEKDQCLPFLDVNITKGDCLSTSLYRKPTFTGLYTAFSSFLPFAYKVGLVKCLFNRAYRICSNYVSMHAEFQRISRFLLDNGYPKTLIEKCLHAVLGKLHRGSCSEPVSTVPRKELLLVLPYTGKHGHIVASKLKRLVSQFYPSAMIRVVFKPSCKLRHFFKVKDSIPAALRSMVVYLFRCSSCNARYIGRTSRHLATRIAEHQGVSPRTNRPVSCPSFSAIRQHCDNCGHPQPKAENFSIVSQAGNPFDLSIMESLHIQKQLPKLNTMLSNYDLQLFRPI